MIEVTLPRPHLAQRAVLESMARFNVLCCGRRFGKTTLAQLVSAQRVLLGQRVLYCAPTYAQTTETWREVTSLLARVTKTTSESRRELLAITGGVFAAQSLASENTLRGGGWDFIVVDEAAVVPDLLRVWNEVLRPMLLDSNGGALFMSTPRGYNDFYTLYRAHEYDDEWRSFHYPSSANPRLDPAEINRMRLSMPLSSFQQEVEALFVARAGLIFDQWGHDNVVEVVLDPARPVLWGVDDGYVHGEGQGTPSYHPRVILWVQFDQQGRVLVLDEYVATLELAEVSVANALARAWPRPLVAYVDSSAQELKSRIHAQGVQTVNGTHPIERGVDVLRAYVRDGTGRPLLLVHPRCKLLIDNMSRWAYREGTRVPERANDDAIDALRYAVFKGRQT